MSESKEHALAPSAAAPVRAQRQQAVVAALAAQAWQGAVVMATFALFSAAVLALGPWVLLRWGRSMRASALGMRLAGLALSLSSGSALYLGLFHNQAPWCV